MAVDMGPGLEIVPGSAEHYGMSELEIGKGKSGTVAVGFLGFQNMQKRSRWEMMTSSMEIGLERVSTED